MTLGAGDAPTVYAVILNWNGWPDTCACLNSLFDGDFPVKVVVCDNASKDDSLPHLRDWARERFSVQEWVELDRPAAEGRQSRPAPRLTLIDNGANLGFAGGNNVGLRYALAQPDCAYLWLLNNDATVTPDTLRRLVRRLQAEPDAGLCGAKVVDAAPPHRVQALGGARFNPWLGTIAPIGAGSDPHNCLAPQEVEARMDYVAGACMLATRAWVEDVGLLSEDYFLYYEEIDWARRAGRRYRQVYAPGAVVFHQGGASIGGPAGSAAIDGLALRNRLRFTRRHYWWALPTVWLGLLGVMARRIRRRQWRRVPLVLAVMFGRWRAP